jgi:hypothetical protein
MTSVGYGDIVASTTMGRGIACFIALWGAFMMSLVVAIITKGLSLSLLMTFFTKSSFLLKKEVKLESAVDLAREAKLNRTKFG